VNGVLYCNDGDWVESRSALVENEQGDLSLVYWQTDPIAIEKPQLIKVT
jgi:UDP-2,3-diacylglucosamine pyrophosphatase LpxH